MIVLQLKSTARVVTANTMDQKVMDMVVEQGLSHALSKHPRGRAPIFYWLLRKNYKTLGSGLVDFKGKCTSQ